MRRSARRSVSIRYPRTLRVPRCYRMIMSYCTIFYTCILLMWNFFYFKRNILVTVIQESYTFCNFSTMITLKDYFSEILTEFYKYVNDVQLHSENAIELN